MIRSDCIIRRFNASLTRVTVIVLEMNGASGRHRTLSAMPRVVLFFAMQTIGAAILFCTAFRFSGKFF